MDELEALLKSIHAVLVEIKNALTREAPYHATTPSRTVTVAATTATKVMDMNRSRRFAVIVNDGAGDVYISFNPNPASGAGIRLNASGGTFSFGPETDFHWSGDVYAYSTAGTSLSIVEG